MKFVVASLFIILIFPNFAFSYEPDFDPFYTEGVELSDGPLMHGIVEDVDLFSGNLKIVQTDLELPQNGGLTLKVQRYYDSAIWSRRDVATQKIGLLAYNRLSTMGMGWYMHFGLLRNAQSMQPVFEGPDGHRRTFYPVPDNASQFISKDYWRLEKNYPIYTVTSPDGTVYILNQDMVAAGFKEMESISMVAQVVEIKNAAETSSINFTYNVES